MIKEIALQFGSSPRQPNLVIRPGAITVFVGPNHSGKSLLLREIESVLGTHGADPVMIEDISLRAPTADEIALLEPRGVRRGESHGQRLEVTKLNVGTYPSVPPGVTMSFPWHEGGWSFGGDPTQRKAKLDAAQRKARLDAAWLFSVFLEGRTRLSLLDDAEACDLASPPTNLLAALFRDDVGRQRIARLTHQAFGRYFTIDATSMRQLRPKFSTRPPEDVQEERGLDDRSLAFQLAAEPVRQFSDGIKAYTGLLAAVISKEFKILLIDEPEAFLHPPLARRIGQNLAELANERDGHVLVATHDADFLMGSIQAGGSVNVVRLSYRDGIATARTLPPGRLMEIMRDPLLRSTGVLRALFHVGAVVTEADADRAFYEEINTRLATHEGGGALDSVFLNAQNKQTIRRIVGPLREMGIPAAAVVDLDILDAADLDNLLPAAFVPDPDREPMVHAKLEVQQHFKRCQAGFSAQGVARLDPPAFRALNVLLADLEKYGIFVVPGGALESWLPAFGVQGKRNWLPRIFDALGGDPSDGAYVTPAPNDVWEFMRRVGSWVNNPLRAGIPA